MAYRSLSITYLISVIKVRCCFIEIYKVQKTKSKKAYSFYSEITTINTGVHVIPDTYPAKLCRELQHLLPSLSDRKETLLRP